MSYVKIAIYNVDLFTWFLYVQKGKTCLKYSDHKAHILYGFTSSNT